MDLELFKVKIMPVSTSVRRGYSLVGLLAREEVRDELLDPGDTGGSTDEDDLVDGGLVDLRVTEDLLDGVHGGSEQILAKFLETGSGDGGIEVDTLEDY